MKRKKIGKIISYLFLSVCLLLVLWVVVGKFAAEKKGDKFYLFGYSLEIVVTDSMTPTIKVGSLVVLKKTDINEVNAAERTGDVICYRSRSGALKGKSILHRAVEKRTEDGAVYLTTRGDKEGLPTDQQSADLQPEITTENFLGVSVFQSYALGRVLAVLRQPLTWVFLIAALIFIEIAARQIRILKERGTDGDGGMPPTENGDDKTDGQSKS